MPVEALLRMAVTWKPLDFSPDKEDNNKYEKRLAIFFTFYRLDGQFR